MIKPQISGRGPIVASQVIPGKEIREQNPKSIKIRPNSLLPVKQICLRTQGNSQTKLHMSLKCLGLISWFSYLIASWIFHLKQESRGQGGGWKLAQQFWHALYPLQEKYREKVFFEIRSVEYSILLQWKNTRTRQDSKLSSKSNLSDKDGAAEKKRLQKTSKL